MTLAHIRNGQIIRRYSGPPYSGWVDLEDGRKASPPVEGFADGNDKIVPVVEETQDTSTGPDIFRSDTGWQVEADRVYRLITIRDMTPAEIDLRDQGRATSEVDAVLGDIQRRALNVLFDTINEVRVNAGQQTITLQQYVTALNAADAPITRDQFINYVKGKL